MWVSCPRIDKCKVLYRRPRAGTSLVYILDYRMMLIRASLLKDKTLLQFLGNCKEMKKGRINKMVRMIRLGLPSSAGDHVRGTADGK